MNYFIGDVQGCLGPLDRLLAELDFSPSRDHLYVLGDLVNRGPASLGVLQRLAGLGDAATCLLGNHDLHLLAVAQGVRPQHRTDTLQPILDAPDRGQWVEWLRHQKLAVYEHGWLMLHAGVVPQWDLAQVLALAGEVEAQLRSGDLTAFMRKLFGNEPARWDDSLEGADRWRCVVNCLVRLRFCAADGTMEFATKEGAGAAPEGYMPWFDVPGRRTAGTPIAFGHWSTLGLVQRPDLLSLDTGCVWGGCLSAARIEGGRVEEIIQVNCPQALRPGQ